MSENQPSNPYAREITSCFPGDDTKITVDVYSIANAYELSPPIAHAAKKLLAAGNRRGDKSKIVDWQEAIESIQWAIDNAKKETWTAEEILRNEG